LNSESCLELIQLAWPSDCIQSILAYMTEFILKAQPLHSAANNLNVVSWLLKILLCVNDFINCWRKLQTQENQSNFNKSPAVAIGSW